MCPCATRSRCTGKFDKLIISLSSTCLCTGHRHFKLQFTLKNARNIKGCRRSVYRLAGVNEGFYLTSVKSESIKYSGDDLVVSIAFRTHHNLVKFFDDLRPWNELHPGILADTGMTSGWGFLPFQQAILHTDYDAEGSSSPEAPASSRSVETDTTVILAADWDTKTHQSISPMKLLAGCGFQLCHIKDVKYCTKAETKDKNNKLAMSPSLHKQYDGHGPGAIPSMDITIYRTHNERVPVPTEGGDTELRTRVDLTVKFLSLEAFHGCDGVLKDGSYQLNDDDPTIWVTWVHVLDPVSFNNYIAFKSGQTLSLWDTN